MSAGRQIRVELGGEWDIDDLGEMASSLRLGYTYFYWLTTPSTAVDSGVRSRIERYFWNERFRGDRFTEQLYHSIAPEHSLRVVSISYNSPGWIVFLGYVAAFRTLAYCTKAWADAGGKLVDLAERIEGYFKDRKQYKDAKTVSLDKTHEISLDEAAKLCNELGNAMGLSAAQITNTVDLAGNPISALRLLVALARENRRVAVLEASGKLVLPDPSKLRGDD